MQDFRGKRLDNGEWAKGFLVDEHHIGNWVEAEPVCPETIGECTGIEAVEATKDGYAKSIPVYEGDIVEAVLTGGIHQGFSWGRHVVVFDRGAFGLKDRRGQVTPMCNYSTAVKFKVLGNIHDHPELMEVTE